MKKGLIGIKIPLTLFTIVFGYINAFVSAQFIYDAEFGWFDFLLGALIAYGIFMTVSLAFMSIYSKLDKESPDLLILLLLLCSTWIELTLITWMILK